MASNIRDIISYLCDNYSIEVIEGYDSASDINMLNSNLTQNESNLNTIENLQLRVKRSGYNMHLAAEKARKDAKDIFNKIKECKNVFRQNMIHLGRENNDYVIVINFDVTGGLL